MGREHFVESAGNFLTAGSSVIPWCIVSTARRPPRKCALAGEYQPPKKALGLDLRFLFYMQTQNLMDLFRPLGRSRVAGYPRRLRAAPAASPFLAIQGLAYREIADPQMDFIYVHFPTPHLFAIYDRKRADFVLSPDTNYLDNLALVDRTVGEIRAALEKAGLWESTALMITSDHAVRPAMWHGRYNWNAAFERLIGPGASRTVPFILKLPRQREAAVYEPSISNVAAAQLSLAALSGEVATPQQALAWLTRQGSRPLVSER